MILDTYVDAKKNLMVTWLTHKGTAFKIYDPYQPTFYVHASQNNLFTLASLLQDNPKVKCQNITTAKLSLGSQTEKLVLEITPKHIADLTKLASEIDALGDYHTYELYNVDLRLSTRYLHHKGVFCNAKVRWDGIQFFLDDEQWAVDYELPQYSSLDLRIEKNHGFHSLKDPLTCIFVDDIGIEAENEADCILTTVDLIQEKDPDIIYTVDGDSFLFPYLFHRAKENDILDQVNFGRGASQRYRPSKQAKSYFSYGQIVYRPAFYTLNGRVHIDRKSSFLYGESGLHGLLDISRCANIPLQLQSRLGPGTAISQIQVNKALDKGYVIPWKKNMPELCKTASQLLISDRGGLILSPVVGLHENIVELDFASLYPNIMLRYNISPETMLCSCCKDSWIRVPQLKYHICTLQTGLLPEVLKPIIYRRFLFKARTKNPHYDTQRYTQMQQAWKWVLIVCFGYTGYRNARFGRIECHESITAFARDILLEAMNTAEYAGYQVLHGIVDSLWVKDIAHSSTARKLSKLIGQQTGIRMDIEGCYQWIVFLPCKQHDVGALTRYYGLFDTGEMKVRGIELRQRNTPTFFRTIQRKLLDIFSQAHNAEEFHAVIPQALDALIEYGRQLCEGTVSREDLVYKTRISKGITHYKMNTLTKSALLQLRDLGIQVQPGQSICYLVCCEHTRDYRQRVRIVETMAGDEPIDTRFYLRQIAKCGESLLLPFGYTKEKLEEKLHASLLSRTRTFSSSI